MEIYDINEGEFKISVLEILSEMRENIDRQFSQLRKQLSKQNEYVTKDTETLKKNQTEILEMKNSMKEMKNELVTQETKQNKGRKGSVILKTEI